MLVRCENGHSAGTGEVRTQVITVIMDLCTQPHRADKGGKDPKMEFFAAIP